MLSLKDNNILTANKRDSLTQHCSLLFEEKLWVTDNFDIINQLFILTDQGKTDQVKTILTQCPEISIDIRNSKNSTILAIAVARHYNDFANYLISKGANIFLKFDNNSTLLHIAVCVENIEMTKKILSLNNSVDSVNILDQQSSSNKTALYYACEKGFVEIVDEILRFNPDLNIENNIGFTPLIISCFCHNWIIVDKLLDAGGDINKRSKYMNEISSPLNVLADGGDNYGIQYLITNYNVKVNVNGYISALFFAIKNNHFSTMELLVNNGAKIDRFSEELIKKKIKEDTNIYTKDLQKFLDDNIMKDFLSDIKWKDDDLEHGVKEFLNEIKWDDDEILEDAID